ncbi:RDD family protein [Methanoregula sp.]|uniref:RDD family protein n=1 Tax=Methanoregula sp. TaxID=2052170 RepID=UPI0035662352
MSRCPRCRSEVADELTHCPVCRKELSGCLYAPTGPGGRTGSPAPDVSGSRIGYAGFWRRFCATIPDLVVVGIAAILIKYTLETYRMPYPLLATLFLSGAFYLLLYSPFWLSSRYQATPGKLLFKVMVVYDNGRRLPFTRALIRELGKYVSLLPFGLGFFLIGFTKKKQGIHDLLAMTVVVKRSDSHIYERTNIQNPVAVKNRIRASGLIICICLACTLAPIAYLGTLPAKTVTPQFFAAQGLSSAADTISGSKYPQYSLDVYDTAIELQPEDTAIQIKKLYVLDRLGRVDEAQVYLEEMIVLHPNETTPVIFKGDLALQQGKFSEALTCYESALAAEPKNARIWIKKGDAHLLIAVTGMQEMRDMYRNLTAHTGKPGTIPRAAPVDAFQTTQPYQDAVKAYNKAIELDPMTSVAISGRILSSTGNLVNTYQGILEDM